MERCITVYSKNENFQIAINEVCKKILDNGPAPVFILFSACNASFSKVTEELHNRFPNTQIVGSTSYLQFCSCGYGNKGISLIALFNGVECSTGVLLEIDRRPDTYKNNVKESLKVFPTYENMCCFEVMTAHSKGEEIVLDTLSSILKEKNIYVYGSTSGTCNIEEDSTMISLNGKLYTNACIFILIKNLQGRIYTMKEHLYRSTKSFFTVTEVDCEERRVFELNDKPASLIAAEGLETSVEDLPARLEGQPMGRKVENEIYIAEAAHVNADYSIDFYAQVYNYTRLYLMEMDDISTVFNKTLDSVKNNIDGSFMFAVNCFSRTRLFEQKDLLVSFYDNLKSMTPVFFGLSGFGEQYNFIHMNQTMILVVFE